MADHDDENQVHLLADPMRAADCRVKPESPERFAATDLLHAFVRIYPIEKLQKNAPDKWTAEFVLRSAAGTVETKREVSFAIDAGSGYLAHVEMPLTSESIRPGEHTLDVLMRGPGIRNDLKESRSISITGAPAP